jgi:pilus assembly protein Flp/PilA
MKGGQRMLDSVRMRFASEEGQALIEYALIVSLISVIAVVALTATGHSISDILNNVSNSV